MADCRRSDTDGARILVVDDHPLFRAALISVINEQLGLTVCGEAADARRAMQVLSSLHPDVAIVDITLKGSSGLEFIKDMKAVYPNVRVLVVSMHDESLYAERCLRAGARGYVMKTEVPKTIIAAVRRVLDGGIYLSEQMSTMLAEKLVTRRVRALGCSIASLSDRELEVFQLMGKGYESRRVATELGISIKCVQVYTGRIREKLKIKNLAELRREAFMYEIGNTFPSRTASSSD